MRRLLGIALAALVCLSGAAVAVDAADAAKKRAQVVRKTRLKAFRSCAALARYGRRHVSRGPGAQPPPTSGLRMPPSPPPVGGQGAPGGAPESGTPAPVTQEDNSTTNVQEQGVDEPDVAKSRGSTIFAIAGEQLHAIDASGAAPKLLASLPVEGYGHELFLQGDRALVFSSTFGAQPEPQPGPQPAQSVGAPIFAETSTLLTEVDVSEPSAMRIVRTEEMPGSFVSARQTGRTARIVISAPSPAIYDESLRGREAGWMPRRVLTDTSSGKSSSRRLAACRRVRRPVAFSGLDLLTVLTVDMSKGLPAVDSDAIESGGEIVYASTGSLYVATQRWAREPASPEQEPPETFTAIHQFDASRAGETSYRASGRVPGFLLNQFAMSEHSGVLRVASTETPTWWSEAPEQESQSFVTTLERSGPALLQLGQVSGLGKGERIFAVRFIEDAAFVVTFRQVDPLYTVDLADPRDPKVLGELKILGYSAYLHPLRNNRLLGVGQDASEEGRLQGTQLSLFDISDLRNPKRLHQRALGFGASSDAEYDHHAFLYWRPTRLAVLPVQSQEFVGAVGFNVSSANGIGEAGRASHAASAGYDAPIRRALVVGGKLFTLSDEGLEQDTLASLAEEAWLPLPRRP